VLISACEGCAADAVVVAAGAGVGLWGELCAKTIPLQSVSDNPHGRRRISGSFYIFRAWNAVAIWPIAKSSPQPFC
jgi:hypothetical protein